VIQRQLNNKTITTTTTAVATRNSSRKNTVNRFDGTLIQVPRACQRTNPPPGLSPSFNLGDHPGPALNLPPLILLPYLIALANPGRPRPLREGHRAADH
jgi:hypothetical protein